MQDIAVGESVTVNVASAFSDPDGDDLTYSAESSDLSVVTISMEGSNATAVAVGSRDRDRGRDGHRSGRAVRDDAMVGRRG